MLVESDLPLVVQGDVDLGIAFIKARALFGEVTVDWQSQSNQARADLAEICIAAESCTITLERSTLRAKALSAWIDITPNTEVEGEHTDGRTNTAVNIDFSCRAVRERNAFAGKPDVQLQILVEVVARLEISRDRGFVIGLGDTAEDVIVHQRAAEGEIPRLEPPRRRPPDTLDRPIDPK